MMRSLVSEEHASRQNMVNIFDHIVNILIRIATYVLSENCLDLVIMRHSKNFDHHVWTHILTSALVTAQVRVKK